MSMNIFVCICQIIANEHLCLYLSNHVSDIDPHLTVALLFSGEDMEDNRLLIRSSLRVWFEILLALINLIRLD